MLNKKNFTALASAAVLMGVTSLANAATYSITGSGETLTQDIAFGVFPVGTVAAEQAVSGDGIVDDTGGVFNSATWTTTVIVTSPLSDLFQTIVTDYDITDALGNGTTTVTSCAGAPSCSDFTIGLASPINPASFGFDFSDINNITWGTVSLGVSPELDGVGIETIINYSAAPLPPTVPPVEPPTVHPGSATAVGIPTMPLYGIVLMGVSLLLVAGRSFRKSGK
jgi:hypothetical protein